MTLVVDQMNATNGQVMLKRCRTEVNATPNVNKLLAAHQYGSSYEVDEDYERREASSEQAEKLQKLSSVYRSLLYAIDEDPTRDGLRKTPERAAKAIWYFTKGYRQNIDGERNF